MKRLYIVARGDLKPGLVAAQSAHALALFQHEHPATYEDWYVTSNNLVILSVPNERSLEDVASMLSRQGLRVSCFKEPDMNGELTAIAAEPDSSKHLSSLPLALKQAA